MTPREKALLTVTCYGHFVSHFNMLVFPAILLPLSGHLGLPVEQVLGLSFIMYLLFGITALPWGLIADKMGAKPLMLVFFLGAGGCGFMASLTVDSPYLFSLCLAGIGLFSGIYHPAGLGWIAKEMEKTSKAMAFNGMFGNLGLASAPLLAGMVNHFLGLEAVYLALCLVNLGGLLLLAAVRNGEPEQALVREKKSDASHGWQPFLVLLCAMTLGGIAYRGTSVTLPAYFELSNGQLLERLMAFADSLGSANLSATLMVSCIYLIGMGGQYAGGWIGERYDLRWSYFAFHVITIPAALAMAATSNVTLVLCATVHSFFLLGMQPIENTLVARLTPPRLHSSAYGMKFILTFGFGALSVKIIERVNMTWGMSSVFIVLGMVSCLLCLVIIVLIMRTIPLRAM